MIPFAGTTDNSEARAVNPDPEISPDGSRIVNNILEIFQARFPA
jgi:hypothetical protein